MSKDKKFVSVDGNTAAAYIGYALSDAACVFPITPSTPMAEYCDELAAKGQKNVFGNIVQLSELQSEGGAAGAVHGAAAAGALVSTYTASQGLLLMIPNMYKIAGECLPVVFHVSARTVAAQALSIFGDHQDVMACRQTGFCMLASNNVQEAMDMALVAHISAIKASLPFLHFFDGFRTSHEINKIEQIPYETIKEMLPMDLVNAFRANGHNPNHPKMTGTVQNDDTYFQAREANNILYDKVYDIVEETMDELGKKTGRHYKPFDYYGAKDATDIIVVMGSGADAIHETIEVLNAKEGKKHGVIKVHLYRPFNGKAFVKTIPSTVKNICVLDRTKESGSLGEPLYEDVVLALNLEGKNDVKVIGGRFGISSKDFTPTCVVEVFNNLTSKTPKNHFTVGINDDVTHTSLPKLAQPISLGKNYQECKFWGLGSDGTISANKSSIKIIGATTDKYVQGYFEYDSKKSGGLTISHLRISDDVIRSPYYVVHANFIAVHKFTFVEKYNVLEGLKKNGTVLLNTIYSKEEIGKHLPENFKNELIKQNARLFIIDALKVAASAGLGNRINVIMQSCFFKIANIIDYKLAEKEMKDFAVKSYSKKGDAIVQANMKAIDAATNDLHEVDVKSLTNVKYEGKQVSKKATKFYMDFCDFIDHHKGNDLPVSHFNKDGSVMPGTSKFEKRNISSAAPEWIPENCIQCGQCSMVCPHAAIRGAAIKKSDLANAPKDFAHKSALGINDAEFTIQVSTKDCVGCMNCVNVCPAKNKALVKKPIEQVVDKGAANWDYFMSLDHISETPFKADTVKGLQFKMPYFEFSGACAGCGESPYIKCVTQLFGDRMIVANATGCSSVFSSAVPTNPYTTDKNGCGPSWGNSLFEDNAEFGYGMYLGLKTKRESLYNHLNDLLSKDITPELKSAINDMIAHKEDNDSKKYVEALVNAAKKQPKLCGEDCTCMEKIITNKDQLSKKSVWIIGGDGWAYDIGYGGLDHVLASGENVNVLVLDTEVYSNTGGQSSKSTPMGSVAKLAAAGKVTRKKDLGAISMTYKNIYVAQVAMGANPNQFLKAVTEAEAYNGPSIIIAYAPCINHGINMANSQLEEKKAVEAGYWQLYRYNPSLKTNKLVIDSVDPTGDYQQFLVGEARYAQLLKKNPERAKKLFKESEEVAKEKLADLKIKKENW